MAKGKQAARRLERERMVERQIVRRGLDAPRVLEAMRAVPREDFVPPEYRLEAYEDAPLPIGGGQTISQPFIVARMCAALELKGDERVLEVGAGSGYAAAILGELAREVHAIERLPELARAAAERMRDQGRTNVHVVEGDGSLGLPDEAPFDAIVVAASGPRVPDSLVEQLEEGGRLVMPVGTRPREQVLVRLRREAGRIVTEKLDAVRFVPLVGAEAWDEDDEA